MTADDVVAWAEIYYPEGLTEKFRKKPPSGRMLSKYKRGDFIQLYGDDVGIAFYNTLVEEGTPRYSVWHSALAVSGVLVCFFVSLVLLLGLVALRPRLRLLLVSHFCRHSLFGITPARLLLCSSALLSIRFLRPR